MNLNELKTKFNIKQHKSSSNIEDLAFQISLMITEARVKIGLTQAQLAKKMGTKQPSIARVENQGVLPSLEFLQKMSKALGTNLIPPLFEFLNSSNINLESINYNNNSGKYLLYVPFEMKAPSVEVEYANNISTITKESTHTSLIGFK